MTPKYAWWQWDGQSGKRLWGTLNFGSMAGNYAQMPEGPDHIPDLKPIICQAMQEYIRT